MNKEMAARRRRVWGMISENPRLSVREIATELYAADSDVYLDMKWLEGAGYISRKPFLSRAVRVLIPLLPLENRP